jgi:signal transduction histidine kinase
LSLSYDIVVKGHGGALEVNSTEGVGLPTGQAGSEFIITLPF